MMVHHEFAKEMDEEEIIANNTQLVFAGNGTTSKLMAITLVALGQHPEQRRMLIEGRSLIPQAVEEIHRWQTLVQTNTRNACSGASDIEGVHIPDGAEWRPLLGAANRDPERWNRTDELDIRRPVKRHLCFGFGMHSCRGMNLARLEIQIWPDQLLEKVPDYDHAAEIDWGRNFMIRGPREVLVVQVADA